MADEKLVTRDVSPSRRKWPANKAAILAFLTAFVVFQAISFGYASVSASGQGWAGVLMFWLYSGVPASWGWLRTRYWAFFLIAVISHGMAAPALALLYSRLFPAVG